MAVWCPSLVPCLPVLYMWQLSGWVWFWSTALCQASPASTPSTFSRTNTTYDCLSLNCLHRRQTSYVSCYLTSHLGQLSLLCAVGRSNENWHSGWIIIIIIIINGDSGCRWWQPTGGLTAQVSWLGLRVDGCLALGLHSSHKPSELSQWPCHGASIVTITIVVIIVLNCALYTSHYSVS